MAQAVRSGPLTRADQLRELLSRCEERVVSPGSGGGLAELFGWMDEIANLWAELEASGVDLRAERTRWEGLQSQVRKRGGKLLRAWQGPESLDAAREAAAPERSHWWWWLDEEVAAQHRRRLLRGVTIAALVALVLGGGSLLLSRLFPVDPTVRALTQLEFEFRDAMTAGDLATAREKLEQSIALKPQDAFLHLQLGALAETTGDPGIRERAFATARELVQDEADYLMLRGQAYLIVGEARQAIRDELSSLEMRPDEPLALFLLGVGYERVGEVEKAQEVLQRSSDLAMESNPQLAVAARTLLAELLQRPSAPTP